LAAPVGKDVFLTQQVALVGFEDMLHVNLTSPSFTYVSSASEETASGCRADYPQAERAGTANPADHPSGQLIARESA
jgi:LacI family transcriptional regulator of maltose regulon